MTQEASIAIVDGLHRAAACFYGLLSVLQSPLSTFVAARCEAAPSLPPEDANKFKNVVKAGLKGKLEFISSFWWTHFSAVAPISLISDLKILLQIVDKTKYTANASLATYLRGIAAIERLLLVMEAANEAMEAARAIKDAMLMDCVEDVVVVETPSQTGSSSLVEEDKDGLPVRGNEPISTTQDVGNDAIKLGGAQCQSYPAVKGLARTDRDCDDEVLEPETVNEEGNEIDASTTPSRLGVVVPPPMSPQFQAIMAIKPKKNRRKALVRFAQELMASRIDTQDDVSHVLTLALALANSKQQRLGILLHRMDWWMRCRQHDLARQDALAVMAQFITKMVKQIEFVRLGAGLAAVEEWKAAAEVYQHGLSKHPLDWQLKAGQHAVLLKMARDEATTRRENEREGSDLDKTLGASQECASDPSCVMSDNLEDEPLPICRRPRKSSMLTKANYHVIETWPERIVDAQLSDGFVEFKREVKTDKSHIRSPPHCQEYLHEKETHTATDAGEEDVLVGQNPVSNGSQRREILEHVSCELVEIRLRRGVTTSQSARRVIMEMLSRALDLATLDEERCEIFTLSAECQLAFGVRTAALADAAAALECSEATVPVAMRLAQFYGGMESWEEAEKACLLGLARTPDDKALLELRERMIEEASSWANDAESSSSGFRGVAFADEEEDEESIEDDPQDSREVAAEAWRTELDAEHVGTRLRVIMAMKAMTARQQELLRRVLHLKTTNADQDAIRVLSEALELASAKEQCVKMLLLLMEWRLEGGQYQLARRDGLRALSLVSTKEADDIKRLADGFVAMREWNTARIVYELGLRKCPQNEELREGKLVLLQKIADMEASAEGMNQPDEPRQPPTAITETTSRPSESQSESSTDPASVDLSRMSRQEASVAKVAIVEQAQQVLQTIVSLEGEERENAKREVIQLASVALELARSRKQQCKMRIFRAECYLLCGDEELAGEDAAAALAMPANGKVKQLMLRLARVFASLTWYGDAARACDVGLAVEPYDDELIRAKMSALENSGQDDSPSERVIEDVRRKRVPGRVRCPWK